MSVGCLWLFREMSGVQGAQHRTAAGPQQERPRQTRDDCSKCLLSSGASWILGRGGGGVREEDRV